MSRLSCLAFLSVFAWACADQAAPPPTIAEEEPSLELPSLPQERLRDLESVEEFSEELANQLIGWGHQLRNEDFTAAAEMLHDDFRGHDLGDPGEPQAEVLDLEVRRIDWDLQQKVVTRHGFLDGLTQFLRPFETLHVLLPKLKQAEFTADAPPWGLAKIQLRVSGLRPGGAPLGRVAWLKARVLRHQGRWLLTHAQLSSLQDLERDRPLFQDVSVAAGVAFQSPRFGTDGHGSFFWNGAAAFDYDADGWIDLFVPSTARNFLYRNLGDGRFAEVAESAGVALPAAGTGAVFFDADRDGDADLLVAQVGFENGETPEGETLQFYENSGDGTFKNASAEAGFAQRHCAFSLAVADVNDDGWLDVYVCGYNRGGFTGPNSWYDATNGTANALYVNRGDGCFDERAAEFGVADGRWSYAASFADFDEDGDQDLYVANDYGRNALFLNDGRGHFSDAAESLGVTDVGNGMGSTWGDYDQDGDLDLYVANMSSTAGSRILRRLAGGEGEDLREILIKLAAGNSLFEWRDSGFHRVPSEAGGIQANWAWSSQFLDLDLDGDQDLLCVNGFISGESGADFKDT